MIESVLHPWRSVQQPALATFTILATFSREQPLISHSVYVSRCLQDHYKAWYSCQDPYFENAWHTRPSTKDAAAVSHGGRRG